MIENEHGQILPDWWTVTEARIELSAMANAMAVLSKHLPTKASFQQGLVFMCMVGAATGGQGAGRSVSELIADHEGSFSPAIRNGYTLFMDDLKWVEQVADATDKRKKVVRLTAAGEAIAAEIANQITKVRS